MNNRAAQLIAVLFLIAGAIFYIESHKVERGSSNVPAVNVVPNASSTAPLVDESAQYPLAKEITDPTGFINTPTDAAGTFQPIKLSDYVGKKVVLLDFWTYSCINCERTLPYVEAWYQKYKDYGLEIVGMHTPEFDFEKVYANVLAGVKKYGITYPVVLDSNYGTWNAYANQYWPAEYLIDVNGYVVAHDIGEGDYPAREAAIQKALQARADQLHTGQIIPSGTVDPSNAIKENDAQTPETYFGSARNEFLNKTLLLGGKWDIQPEYAQASADGDTITYPYNAKNVYFVASSDSTSTLSVMQDGVLINTVQVKGAELYTLVQNAAAGAHNLVIKIKGSGLKAFTFTFG